jgi:hypothetical protein
LALKHRLYSNIKNPPLSRPLSTSKNKLDGLSPFSRKGSTKENNNNSFILNIQNNNNTNINTNTNNNNNINNKNYNDNNYNSIISNNNGD